MRLDEARRRRHKRINLLHTLLLLGGMAGLMWLIAWMLVGPAGAVGVLAGGMLALLLAPRMSPALLLRMYRARPLGRRALPDVHAALDDLAGRAGLLAAPTLWYVPSASLNAFPLRSDGRSAIAVTDGLLRMLDFRELAGVLAHELSHLRNRDLWVMNLADGIGRITTAMSWFGMLLLLVSLPAWLASGVGPSLLPIVLLVLAPTIGSLLQLALSRAREYDADLDAAALTGDPAGLASALRKLERHAGGLWERVMLPGPRVPEPSLLRTHPPTEERVARLLSLAPAVPPRPVPAGVAGFGHNVPPVPRRPRRHVHGLWY